MNDPSPQAAQGDITELLHGVRLGESKAFQQLLPVVYDELRRIARRQMRRERADHTLHPTDLVNEVYLKLVDQAQADWQGRAHFFGIAARAMRQVLIDHARRRAADKRGGDWERTTLENQNVGLAVPTEELLALDAALDRLDDKDPRLRQIVEFRFFAGMTEEEVAEVLDLSVRTVQRDWAKARAWLYRELYRDGGSDPRAR